MSASRIFPPSSPHRRETPEDGSLWVYGVGEDGVPAFTRYGIDNLRQIIVDERAAGNGPPLKPPK